MPCFVLLLLLQSVWAQFKENVRQGFVMNLVLSSVAGMALVKAAKDKKLEVSEATVSVCVWGGCCCRVLAPLMT